MHKYKIGDRVVVTNTMLTLFNYRGVIKGFMDSPGISYFVYFETIGREFVLLETSISIDYSGILTEDEHNRIKALNDV